MEQIREQSRIRESNYEEEITILKEQVKDRDGSLICFGGKECAEDQADANWQLLLSILV